MKLFCNTESIQCEYILHTVIGKRLCTNNYLIAMPPTSQHNSINK